MGVLREGFCFSKESVWGITSSMLRIGLLFLLWLSAVGWTSAETLRIATYNLRNYLIMDRLVGGQWRPEYPKPEAEKAAIREAILEVEPDVLVLQEIGGPGFLEELRRDLEADGLGYPHAMLIEAADEVRHVAVLSRVEPTAVARHTDLDFKYLDGREVVKRGMLELTFAGARGGAFKLFAVHLKSRWTEHDADPEAQQRRAREARACRNRVIERTFEAGRPAFMVVGDFNDHPNSAPLRRFDHRGDLQIGTRLEAVDSRGEHWTYFYAKALRYSTVDGFVLSEPLMPQVVGGEGRVHDGAGSLQGTDHRMVYLDLAWGREP